MPLACSSTWSPEGGPCPFITGVLRLGDEDGATLSCIKLHRPQGGDSCTIILDGEVEQERCSLAVTSNSRLCEVSVQCHDDAAPSYVSTVRAQPTDCGSWYQADIPLQALPSFERLHLKLLSLQGDKNTCSICKLSLHSNEAQPPTGADTSSTPDGRNEPSSRVLLSTSMSQMDEVRLLNERLLSDGGAACDEGIPASLELLMSKALQLPATDAVAMSTKALSTSVAQGVLQQYRGQLQQQQHMQQQGTDTTSSASLHSGTRTRKPAHPATAPAASPALHSGTGSEEQTEVVLRAITRLEAKMNHLLAAVRTITTRLHVVELHLGIPSSTQTQ